MVTGANKPLHRQDSNNTAASQNTHLIAEPINASQNPVNQIALANRETCKP